MAPPNLLYVVAFLERADEAVMPACYAAVAHAFEATPSQLGVLTTARAALQAVASLPAGTITDRCANRYHVVAASCIAWGGLSLLVAMSPTYALVLLWRALTGAALATALPATLALLVEGYEPSRHGRAFGMLHIIAFGGSAVCTMVATPMSTSAFLLGGAVWEGWRVVFLIVGAASVLAGGALMNVGVDHRGASTTPDHPSPAPSNDGGHDMLELVPAPPLASAASTSLSNVGRRALSTRSISSILDEELAITATEEEDAPPRGARRLLKRASSSYRMLGLLARNTLLDARHVWRVRTLQVVVIQGMVGSIPWKAMLFLTLYLQTGGFTSGEAGIVSGAWLGGNAIGGWLGGYVSDAMASRWPNRGRIAAAQISVSIGIPFSILMYDGIPLPALWTSRTAAVATYSLTACVMALGCSWCGGINNAMMSAVIHPQRRSAMFAFDRFAEGLVSSFSSVGVGLIAEAIGWRRDMAPGDLANANALGRAIAASCAVPWLWCLFAYGALHWVYPRDVERVAMASQ